MRTLIVLLLLSLAGAGGVWYWWQQGQATPGQAAAAGGGFKMPPPTVEVATVSIGNVERDVQAVGTLRANESVTLRPEIAGRVVQIHFDEGRPVAKDDPLITLDDSVLGAQLEQSQAKLEMAKISVRRVEELVAKRAASVDERDRLQAELRANQASVNLGQAQLSKTRLTAPFAGIAGLRSTSVGDYVSAGQDLVTLVQIHPIKVDFRVGEVFLSSVAAGQTISVTLDAFPGEQFRGDVYALEPYVDIDGRSILIRARIANPDGRLKPGLFARVRLVLTSTSNAVLVPEDAIVPEGDAHYVYTLNDGRAVYTQVELGQRMDTRVEVLKGLTASDTIVTSGQLKLRDGMQVNPVNMAAAAPAGAVDG